MDAEWLMDVFRSWSAASGREAGGKGRSAGSSDARWKDWKLSSKLKKGTKSVVELSRKVNPILASECGENIIKNTKKKYWRLIN